MSRSGYTEDFDDYDGYWSHIRWRGQVASAIRGKRGQALLHDLAEALDTMPDKRLIAHEFWNGEGCALGVLAARRNIDPITVDKDDYDRLGNLFGVAHQLIQEIEFENDEQWKADRTPEGRWRHMREWVRCNLRDAVP